MSAKQRMELTIYSPVCYCCNDDRNQLIINKCKRKMNKFLLIILNPGLYLVRLVYQNREVSTVKFVKKSGSIFVES